MLLSIIIPLYNAEKYVSQTIDTLVNQDLKSCDYEIIVVNDGSKDNGPNIVANWANSHPNIRLINQENSGQSSARNKGINEARGEYLMFVDSDDYIATNIVGKLVSIAKRKTLDILTFGVNNNSDMNYDYKFKDIPACNNVYSGIEYVGKYNYLNGPWWYLIRKTFIANNNLHFIEGRFVEDAVFTLECFLKAKRMSSIDIVVYTYILRPQSTITSKEKSHQIKMIKDYIFAASYIDKQVRDLCCSDIPKDTIVRCNSRKNSFVLFALIRAIKARLTNLQAVEILDRLISAKLYPFQRVCKVDYKSINYTILTLLLNCKIFFLLACRLSNLTKK